MKVLPALLAVSLLGNAVLLTLNWQHATPSTLASNGPKPAATTSADASATASPTSLSPAVTALLMGKDPEALRNLLRSAGIADEMLRGLVQMCIWKKYETRFKALDPQPTKAEASRVWWKDEHARQNEGKHPTADQREAMRQLQREVETETKRLLGEDPDQNHWQAQQLSFLAPEKREAIQKVRQDYDELMNEVQEESQGFQLAADEEKLRYLQAEQQRDIEALMTPAERLAYELRESPTAQQLRWTMTQLDATEQEYRAIFPLQKTFDEKYNLGNSSPSTSQPEHDSKYWQERQEAEAHLQAQIKEMVGAERYAAYIRQQDNDWQQLEAATQRLGLPADTPTHLYALRDTTAAAAQQIASNTQFSSEQKQRALAELAQSTRNQVRTRLGAAGAEAYFKNGGMSWLQEIAEGNVVVFNTNDSHWATKTVTEDPQGNSGP